MCWFSITPVIGGELLQSERFWASSFDLGMGRAMGRLEERFATKGAAYAAVGATYRIDELGPNPEVKAELTSSTLMGTIVPEVDDHGNVTASFSPAEEAISG